MSVGRVKEVLKNSLHVANVGKSHASTVEAYWNTESSFSAACGGGDAFSLLTWSHSIISEPKFVSPFQATLNALDLQWEVGKEVGLEPSLWTFKSVAHSHSRKAIMSQRPRPDKSLRHVRFEDHIDVLLGNEDDLDMHCIQVTHSTFRNWPLKPWKKRFSRSRILWSAVPSSLDPLSELAVSSRLRDFLQVGKPAFSQFDQRKDAYSHSDEYSNMQTSTLKHDVHPEPTSNMLNALTGSHGPPQEYQDPSDNSNIISDGEESFSPDSQSHSAGMHPPSSTEHRQEVVMFHLQDDPIRAFLDWTDYDTMIREIGYHYSVNPDAVVDAYEINVPLRGIPEEAVPIIVHLFPDIGAEHFASAVLVLLDIDLHGHISEANFRTGPTTQRFVLQVPEWSSRATILFLANVALYCRLEGGRCLVWHDELRWPDYDLELRRIAHGDYIRIAIPPTQRFDCPTAQTLIWTQAGLSDQEILSQAVDQDALSGYSPSLLSEAEVRALARQESDSAESDISFTMQTQSSRVVKSRSTSSGDWNSLSSVKRDVFHAQGILFPQPVTCSLTDEFLKAVAAAQEAERMGPPLPDPSSIEQQPEIIQELWERYVDFAAAPPVNSQTHCRVESWFLHHTLRRRGHRSRITLLSNDFLSWRSSLIATWQDLLVGTDDIDFALVHPATEDATVGVIAQIIVTQQAVQGQSSAVISVYDSDEEAERNPYTFAQVVTSRLTLDDVVLLLQLQNECPPMEARNLCSLWFGRIPIASFSTLRVHHGHAFRFVISRGLQVNIQDLLMLDHEQMCNTLQRSIRSDIYIRPPDPSFLQGEGRPNLPAVASDAQPQWMRWIAILQQRFDSLCVINDLEEGPILYVNVWYVNEHQDYHCGRPIDVKLSSDPLAWRTELVFGCRERLLRASAAELFTVLTPSSSRQVHVIVAQGLLRGSHAVFFSVRGLPALGIQPRQFVHVMLGRILVAEVLRLAVPIEHAHRPATVQFNGQIYQSTDVLFLQSGDSVVVEISDRDIELLDDLPEDESSLVQVSQVISAAPAQPRQPIACKPASFTVPDDLPMTFVGQGLPVRRRPFHDGNIQWSLELGELFSTHGTRSAWEEDHIHMEVTTWYVDHVHRPRCSRPRVVQLVGNAVTWIEDLRAAWMDQLDPSTLFSIHMVHPRPPQFRVQRSVCHLLLEQGQSGDLAAVVSTALFAGYPNDGIIQGAYSVSNSVNLASIIRTMDIVQFCTGRTCTWLHTGPLLQPDVWIQVRSGTGLRVRIDQTPPADHNATEQELERLHFEDLAIMQTSLSRDQPSFQFNPAAPAFDPSLPYSNSWHVSQPSFFNELSDLWRQHVLTHENECASAAFLTWYVAPEEGEGRCLFGRRVDLLGDSTSWAAELRSAWSDRCRSGVEVKFILVPPQPHMLEPNIAGHIILEQLPLEHMTPVLLTIQDTAVHAGHPFRLVLSVGAVTRRRDILQGAGYDRDCYSQGAACEISTRFRSMAAHEPIVVQAGVDLYLKVTRAFLPAGWKPPILPVGTEVDGLSLLQKSVHQRPALNKKDHVTVGSRNKPQRLRLVVWFLDDKRPICRSFRSIRIDASRCLARAAEQLWHDVILDRPCQIHGVTTMYRCDTQDLLESNIDEVGFLVTASEPASKIAIVLEGALLTGSGPVSHLTALFADPACKPVDLWQCLHGRSGIPNNDALTYFVQGNQLDGHHPVHPDPGYCFTFVMDCVALARCKTRIEFGEVVKAFEWFDSHLFLPIYDLPVHFPLLPSSLAWTNEWWEPEHGGSALRVYFDGSFVTHEEGCKAGAAVAAFMFAQGRWKFAGAVSTALPSFTSSYKAEIVAGIIASKFAYDILKLVSVVEIGAGKAQFELTFCYDSLTAGSQASGHWHAFSEPMIGHLLRSMHKCIEQRFQPVVRYTHVKAHAGEPGNELVDTLAHQAALGEPLHDLDSWANMMVKRSFVQTAEWFWYLFRVDVQWDDHALLLPAAPETDHIHLPAKPASVERPVDTPEIGILDLTLATCNVLSLLPRNGKKDPSCSIVTGPARQECILRQMEDEKVHAFALQETRPRKSSNAHDPRFWLYRANATAQGHYGILVGLARTRPIGTICGSTQNTKVYIEQDDVAVIASDPRFLILRLQTALTRVIIIAGHAPHTGATTLDISRWWEDLAKHIPSKYNFWPRILLADANARVGSEPCQHIGPHQAEDGNGKEEAFVQFVRKQGLLLPATFPACHCGDGGTWRHAQGKWSRNDYIGIPVEWHYESCRSHVSTLIDAGLAKEDHRAPIVRLV